LCAQTSDYAIGLSPRIRRTSIMMMATTRRMCMNPEMVYPVTMPKSQRMRRITAIVVSMVYMCD
jgi:hypothetical protein